MSDTTKLVNIKDLYDSGNIEVVKKTNKLMVLVNQDPKPDWLLDHPMAKGVKYLPIERVEFLLTAIFENWKLEIKDVKVIANSVAVTVKLHYKNPVTNEWDWQDGLGAAPIQTDKGAAANDWTKTKTDGVMKAAPAAESYALKDAAEKIGKIFGKDINRKHSRDYNVLIGKFKQDKQTLAVKLSNLLDENQDKEQTNRIRAELIEAEEMGTATVDMYERLIDELLSKKL